MQKPSKKAQQEAAADAAAPGSDDLLHARAAAVQGQKGRQENTWTRMLAKLEAIHCVSCCWPAGC